MRVLVCGGRDFTDRDAVYRYLDRLNEEAGIGMIIHGDASGADTLAKDWGEDRGVHVEPEPAEWGDIEHPEAVVRYRKDGTPYDVTAGHRRNQLMLDKWQPDLVVAFPGKKGTASMVRKAKAAGIEVFAVPGKN